MATQDVTLTLKWDQAVVGAVGIVPQADGSIMLEAFGTCKDAGGALHQLGRAQIKIQPGQVAAVDNMLARALIELRKANGLES